MSPNKHSINEIIDEINMWRSAKRVKEMGASEEVKVASRIR